MVGLLITSVLALAAILILIYVFRRLSQQNLRLKKIRQAPLQHAAPGVGSWPGQGIDFLVIGGSLIKL